MNTLLMEPPAATGATPFQTRRLTAEEVDRMFDTGVLSPDDRVELIEGVLVEMPKMNPEHADCVERLDELFGDRFRPRYRVRPQLPISVSDISEPQPDLVVLPRVIPDRHRHPTAEDVLLAVEVSDSTERFDTSVKRSLYARHGVAEYWIALINRSEVHVLREPVNGDYSVHEVRTGIESLSCAAAPDVTFRVEEFFAAPGGGSTTVSD